MSTHPTEPTYTSRVLETLVALDDFASLDDICDSLPGLSRNSIQVTLVYLSQREAIASMESGGRLWWYATPENDNRSKRIEERRPEKQKRHRPLGIKNHGKRRKW